MSDKHNDDFDDDFEFDEENEDEFDEEDDDVEDDDEEEKAYYAQFPKNDFIFDIHGNKILFKNVAWHEHTYIIFINNEDTPYIEYDLERLFHEYMWADCKIDSSITHNSAEDFYFCLCASRIEFSCINKPVITPFFDFDCLSGEEIKRRQELEEKYRQGLMPPDITYEFPVTIPYKGQDISCIVRFRDTAWYEIDRFTVELAKGEPVPEGWQKNEYGEYAFPNDDLWKARGFSNIFPAYDMQCSPYRMYLRLGKTRPLEGYVSEEPPRL